METPYPQKMINDTTLIATLNSLATSTTITTTDGFANTTATGDVNVRNSDGCTSLWLNPSGPYYLPYVSYWNYIPAATHDVIIDKAENGFIITKNGKKYVAKKAEEVVKYLKEEK